MNHWVFAIRNCSAHRLNGLWPRAEQMGPSVSTRHTWESANLNECVKLDPHTVFSWVCQPNYSGLCKWIALSFWSLALFLRIKQIYRPGGQTLASDREGERLSWFHSPGQQQIANVSACFVVRRETCERTTKLQGVPWLFDSYIIPSPYQNYKELKSEKRWDVLRSPVFFKLFTCIAVKKTGTTTLWVPMSTSLAQWHWDSNRAWWDSSQTSWQSTQW